MPAPLGAVLPVAWQMSAQVKRQSVVLNVAGFPVAEDRHGSRFTPTTVRIERSCGVHQNPDANPDVVTDDYATVTLVGSPTDPFGCLELSRTFMLSGRCAIDYPAAPDWLRAVLINSGVQW